MTGDDNGDDNFELRFAPALQEQDIPDTVLVRRTEYQGPGGHPIYADATGAVRAEISDQGEVRMLTTSARQVLRRPVSCRRAAPQAVRHRRTAAA